jgi:hypothetical protein
VPGVNNIKAYNYNDVLNLSVFPNPVTNIVTIKAPSNAQVEIYNVEGQQVQSFIAACSKTKIDVSAFPSGVYLIKAINENGIAVIKFVKE